MRVSRDLARLRAHTLAHLLFPPTGLAEAIERLGFVQADPIRSPAPAQDLILRHRVAGYRVDDLLRGYASLDIEEGVLYAYGFMPRRTWLLLRSPVVVPLSAAETRVLEMLRAGRPLGPRDVDEALGRSRVRGDWGGQATAGKQALDRLHRRGLARVSGRDKGIRVYEIAAGAGETPSPGERLRRVAMVVVGSMGPVPKRSLQATLAPIGRALLAPGAGRAILAQLLQTGELAEGTFDGLGYVWPPIRGTVDSPGDEVRLLAPFDSVVRDRMRFEHLWGWTYRFEAYTPDAKRARGYYAMPLLWRDAIIGWANAREVDGTLDVEFGYVRAKPKDRAFTAALDAEIARIEAFLGMAAHGGGTWRARR